MSIVDQQNILGRTTPLGASYSFRPYSGTTTRGADFEYTSPSRSYAPDSSIRGVLSQPTGREKGVDGKDILNSATDTVYGPNADGSMVRNMSENDSTLLTGIANIISGGETFDTAYFAKTYFRNRTARASKSLRNTLDEGGNKGGSGVLRPLFTAAHTYPTSIQTTAEGAESVPELPSPSESSPGLTLLIPIIPAADAPPADDGQDGEGNVGGSDDAGKDPDAAKGNENTEDSTTTVNVEGGNDETVVLDNNSDGGDNTFDPTVGHYSGSNESASTGVDWDSWGNLSQWF